MSKKKNKYWATIYTISTHDDTQDNCNANCTGGSYLSRERAVMELAKWLFERMEIRKDLAYDFSNDINHTEMNGVVERTDDGGLVFKGKTEADVRKYVEDSIDMDGDYTIFNEDWNDLFQFRLEENDLELFGDGDVTDLISQIVTNGKKEGK